MELLWPDLVIECEVQVAYADGFNRRRSLSEQKRAVEAAHIAVFISVADVSDVYRLIPGLFPLLYLCLC